MEIGGDEPAPCQRTFRFLRCRRVQGESE